MGTGVQTELFFQMFYTVGSVVIQSSRLTVTSKQVNLQTKINLLAYFINIINMNIIANDELDQ